MIIIFTSKTITAGEKLCIITAYTYCNVFLCLQLVSDNQSWRLYNQIKKCIELVNSYLVPAPFQCNRRRPIVLSTGHIKNMTKENTSFLLLNQHKVLGRTRYLNKISLYKFDKLLILMCTNFLAYIKINYSSHCFPERLPFSKFIKQP